MPLFAVDVEVCRTSVKKIRESRDIEGENEGICTSESEHK